MNTFGFVTVAAAVPELKVGHCSFNTEKIIELAHLADKKQTQVVCFPELCITAYTCADLFFTKKIQQETLNSIREICVQTAHLNTILLIGAPLQVDSKLYNTAIVVYAGKVRGIVPKTHIPNNGEFYEKRWFASAKNSKQKSILLFDEETPFGTDLIFKTSLFSFGIEICEDLWSPIPPSSQLSIQGAEIIFNLSASNELIGKQAYRKQLVTLQSARCHAGYVYASAGVCESTTDLVFSGSALIAENGSLLAESERFKLGGQLIVSQIDIERLNADRLKNSNFESDRNDPYRVVKLAQVVSTNISEYFERIVAKHPFVPPIEQCEANCQEVFNIQLSGLAKRWIHTKANTMVIGVSGGLDSTLALLVCVKTADKLGYDRKRIVGITMPGFGTTNRTYQNAIHLMKSLGVTSYEISIKEACLQHFKDIGHNPDVHDVTYENTQARERTKILMNMANKTNGLVVGTGDLSELALGWATYNGDQMSMYGVNAGIPKTLVRYLVHTAATQLDKISTAILMDILDTPVSPELLPADEQGNIVQKTEDVVGTYELHDFFLYYFVRFGFTKEKILFLAKQAFVDNYTEEVIQKWLSIFMRRFYQQQFKRSCMPDGPKVGSINLSPRGDWRMPSDACLME